MRKPSEEFIAALMLLVLVGALYFLYATAAHADEYGQSTDPTGATQQLTAGTSNGTVTVPASSYYVTVQNEGSNFAYATCKSATATTPGGACTSCQPISPNGGGAILHKPVGNTTCAAITATGTSVLDFTPNVLY